MTPSRIRYAPRHQEPCKKTDVRLCVGVVFSVLMNASACVLLQCV